MTLYCKSNVSLILNQILQNETILYCLFKKLYVSIFEKTSTRMIYWEIMLINVGTVGE